MIRQVKARRLKVEDTEIGDALWKCRGVVTEAADRLGVSRTLVSERIKKNPQLQYIRDSARRMCMGYAEAGLDQALAENKPWAILFVLRTLGRTDGLFDPEPWPAEPLVDADGPLGTVAASGQETQGGSGGTGEGEATGQAQRKKPKAVARIELDEECGQRLDGGHRKLLDALEDGAPWAIKYCLKTFGASKGYAPPKVHAGPPTYPKEFMTDPIRRTPETTTYYEITEFNQMWVVGDGTTVDDSTLGNRIVEMPFGDPNDHTVIELRPDEPVVDAREVATSSVSEQSQTMIVDREVEGAQSFVEDEPRGAQSLGQANDGSGEVQIRVIKDVQPLTAQKAASRGAQSQRKLNRSHRSSERPLTAVLEDDQSVADNNPRGSDPTSPRHVPLRLEWAGNEVAKSLDPDVERSQVDADFHAVEQQGDVAGAEPR